MLTLIWLHLLQLAVDTATRHFPHISKDSLKFQTNELEICDGEYVDISPETWGDVIDLIASISIPEAKAPELSVPSVSKPKQQCTLIMMSPMTI